MLAVFSWVLLMDARELLESAKGNATEAIAEDRAGNYDAA